MLICLSCHTKGNRVFWSEGQQPATNPASVACTNCHKIMEDVSPKFQLAKETVIDTCGTCHVQKYGNADAQLAHAAGGAPTRRAGA